MYILHMHLLTCYILLTIEIMPGCHNVCIVIYLSGMETTSQTSVCLCYMHITFKFV